MAGLLVGEVTAQTVLIGFDDGIPSNGIHEASVRNGGFEESSVEDGTHIDDVPYWESQFTDSAANGDSVDGPWVSDTGGNSLPHHSWVGGWQSDGNPRRQLRQTIPASDWTIMEGDTFHLHFALREDAGMDDPDAVKVKVYAYNGSYTEIGEFESEAPDDGSYGQANMFFSVKSPDYNGRQLAIRILGFTRADRSDRGELAAIDDVSLTAIAVPTNKPNIIFILADDLGWVDISSPNTTMGTGSDFYQTPNIDGLATDGLAFNSFYVNANCAPTRAAFLSGRFACGDENGVYNVDGLNRGNGTPDLKGPSQNEDVPVSATTLAEMLKGVGYMTAHVGKYHCGGHEGGTGTLPLNQGFDWNYGGTRKGNPGNYIANTSNQFGSDNVGPELDAFASPYTLEYITNNLLPFANGNDPLTIVGDRKHLTDAEADACIEFLSDHYNSPAGRSGRPFYLQWHSYSVHTPVSSRADLKAKYAALPDGTYNGGDAYAGLIEGQDQAIARILAFLDDPNGDGDTSDSISANTLVIYASDNGGKSGSTNNDPLRAWKGAFFEGGIRVPFIARMPGTIPSGAITDAFGQHVDLYPTFMELAGGTTDTDLDGVSLWPMLTDPTNTVPPRTAAYFHFPGYLEKRARPCSTIIKDVGGKRYKLIYNYDYTYDPDTGDNIIKELSQPWELYNLTDDISETQNLIGSIGSSYTGWLLEGGIANNLAEDLLSWLEQPSNTTWIAKQPTVRATGAGVPYLPFHVPEVTPGVWTNFNILAQTNLGNAATFTWTTENGFVYDILESEDLADWSVLETGIVPTGHFTSHTIASPGGTASNRFYKVRVRRP